MSLNRKPLNTDEDEMRLVQTPRKFPLPVPSAGVFDAPYRLVLCNVEWWSHVSGMIDVLSALDAWLGDDDEKTRGIREIAKLLSTDWSAMFVEDIRYNDDPQMLQFYRGGEWHDVTDWLVLMDYIFNAQETADNAVAVNVSQAVLIENLDLLASEAWGKADDAQIVNVTQNERLDEHDSQISSLQSADIAMTTRVDGIDIDIANIGITLADHEARITDLEDASAFEAVWSEEFDFTASDGGWSGGNPYSAGNGWLISSAALSISYTGANVGDSRVTFVTLQLRRFVGTGFISATFTLGGENSQECTISPVASGPVVEWMQINRITNSYTQEIAFTGITGLNSFYIEKATFWGRGINPF